MFLKTRATLKQLCLTEREIPSQQLSRNCPKVLLRNIVSNYDLASVQLISLALTMSCQVQQLRINCMGPSPSQNVPCKLTKNKTTVFKSVFKRFLIVSQRAAFLAFCYFGMSGNNSRLPISTRFCQRCNFDGNSLILSVLVSRFLFRSCIRVFNSFRW